MQVNVVVHQTERIKTMTNRDFIRNLTYNEMAEFFCQYFITGFKFMPENIKDEMRSNIVKWLQSEYEFK